MDSVNLIRRLHEHRAWVNDRLLTTCELLSAEQRQQLFQIGQGSIWRSLVHLYAAEYHWLNALLGNDDPLVPGDIRGFLPGNQQGEGGLTSFADLKEKWREQENRWQDYLATLQPESLDDMVYKTSASSGLGKRWGTRRADILLHVCTHSQYTTAQVVNMLRQAGFSPLPDVMLISLARQQTTDGAPGLNPQLGHH